MPRTALLHAAASPATVPSHGPLGRLGVLVNRRRRGTLVAWGLLVVLLGLFAPRVESALAGAGWEASGSESVRARDVVQREFGGLSSSALQVVVHDSDGPVVGNPVLSEATALLQADPRISTVIAPQAGLSVSSDGRTAVIQAGAAVDDPNELVRAAGDLKDPLRELGGDGVTVALTGSSGLWSDFNEANLEAMLKSELYSWPVTLAILVLAFGSLVAAGLPLLLTITGLVAAAGSLYLGTLVGDISIWAMNFAMMFALALGIDYALFIVVRFRAARAKAASVEQAVAETLDTAGKAVLFSGITVLISLSAVMLVPSPAFRSMALGIMLAVVFVLGASLTLLPAVLAKLDGRINAVALPWASTSDSRSPRFASWAERLWKHPVALGTLAVVILTALALPVLGLRTGMPSIKVVPASDSSRVGYDLVNTAFGPGASGTLQIVVPSGDQQAAVDVLAADPGIAQVMPAMPSSGTGAGDRVLLQAVPSTDASALPPATPSTGCASSCPQPHCSVGPPPRTTTSRPC